ncbi:indolepyruvate ferredoxin oxidoreductase subunit alpha [Methanobrevibacter sp. OttesenSCG-928-K11]|nr:indolepyruvate ferredoxin oxidoreductase subunit alpha [Methanobrevibacter sp. OttesenSCG-928-K11]MDL2270671.1 indolepyruvate ferredoxin oxidoreductase subunit alpha [Methanobrevibacter sp. OttesenSCG-928-I08]
MNLKEIVTGKKGDKQFLLGNEAAVRGAIEAGVSVAATYPGTPSSEIGNVLSVLAKDAGIYFEFSTNEKVAMEVAATAAASGLRSFTFMKHVGLNVASDSFMTTAYSGVRGGMVILVADDPSVFSSQNEQDTRHFARLANLPLLEPSNCQELKDMMVYAFDLSEQFELPVIIRTTTRISHMRGIVELGNIKEIDKSSSDTHWKKGIFKKNPSQYVPVPAFALSMHERLWDKIEKINDVSNKSEYNINLNSKNKLGVISSSSAFNYAYDTVNKDGIDLSLLKIGFSYPFPKKQVYEFIKDLEGIFVVEEVDPIMEKEVLAVIGEYGLNIPVYGKIDKTFPMFHEFNQDIVKEGFNKILNYSKENYDENYSQSLKDLINEVPNRAPVLCAGCPHRSMFYAVRKAMDDLRLKNDDVIFASDIGCYTLGINPPYETADYLLSMGSSIGDGGGFSVATNQKVVSFIGDSTFFHSGIAPLVNAVHNKQNFIVTVLDNRITAMTGGQPNPGMPIDGMGDVAPEISIRKIALATGCDFVKVINPMNLEQTIDTYKQAFEHEGVSVIISKYPCTLIKGLVHKPPITIDENKCNLCNKCVNELACPAISLQNNKIVIDSTACDGCGLCMQVCKYGALKR